MMPRHRKDCGPRHGALRREGRSRRSVLPRAPGFGSVFGRDVGQALAPPSRRPRLHLARSLLATPWFAAGAGIVIAAVLAVDSPTALTYGPPSPYQCPVHGCGPATGQPGQPATATPGIALKAPGLDMKGGATNHGRQPGLGNRGVLLGYQIVRQWSSGFLALITLPDARTDGWSLWLAFPAAHVDRVWGARWQPSGNGDGGTADGPSDRHGHSPWGERVGADELLVSATGTPQAPSSCALDGVSCRFGENPSG